MQWLWWRAKAEWIWFTREQHECSHAIKTHVSKVYSDRRGPSLDRDEKKSSSRLNELKSRKYQAGIYPQCKESLPLSPVLCIIGINLVGSQGLGDRKSIFHPEGARNNKPVCAKWPHLKVQQKAADSKRDGASVVKCTGAYFWTVKGMHGVAHWSCGVKEWKNDSSRERGEYLICCCTPGQALIRTVGWSG